MNSRWNPLGLPREKLLWTLQQETFVKRARDEDSCLLCCGNHVNEAGLCEICWALLGDKELQIALKWIEGRNP